MITDRNKILFVTICFCCYCCTSLLTITEAATLVNALTIQQQQQQQQEQQQQIIKDNPIQQQPQETAAFDSTRILNPRMDYNNEWRPLGRGDPLKKDPTYDYSPPVLESVHYWRDSGDKDATNGIKTETNEITDNRKSSSKISKQDILLLGVTSERLRPAITTTTSNIAHKNAKGELPLLQPKYTSIRRSYYAHHLPTHLMPPPMSTQNMIKPSSSMTNNDYSRHSMHSVSSSYMAAHPSSSSMPTSMQSMQHSKPYYSTTSVTSPWTHTQHGNVGGTTTTTMHHIAHNMPHMVSYDSHHQESANYHSYTHSPSMGVHSKPAASIYSPNAIQPSQYASKPNSATASRKPWVHELLQKELIKPNSQHPTMMTTKFVMGTTAKPFYAVNPHIGISSTLPPMVSYIPSLMTTASTTTTSTTRKPPTPLPMSIYTSSPVYITTTAAPMPKPPTTTTTTTTPSPYNDATRLLIPNTSNLAFRPTVAPMEMTTDALFSHYKQPEKPLMGPMYLIIEGHSKVKTYGKDELDPHQPKIVPIIPKREPIVRVADPNDKRGGVETFQVKHLHSNNVPSTTPKALTTTIPNTTKVPKPPMMPKFTMKPLTTTTTTMKPSVQNTNTTTMRPTPMASMDFRPTVPAVRQQQQQPTTILTKVPDMSAATSVAQPPTGMQGLLSILDGFFEDEPHMGAEAIAPNSNAQQTKVTDGIYVTLPTSTLRPLQAKLPLIDARLTNKADTIAAESDGDADDDNLGMTTIPPPRGIRQVFDYDQLPEARLKQLLAASYDDDAEDDAEYLDVLGQPIKRIDKVMDYDLDVDMKNGEEEDEKAEEDDEEYDNEDDNDDEVAVNEDEVERADTKELLKHP